MKWARVKFGREVREGMCFMRVKYVFYVRGNGFCQLPKASQSNSWMDQRLLKMKLAYRIRREDFQVLRQFFEKFNFSNC